MAYERIGGHAVFDWPERKVIDLQNDGLLLVADGNHGNDRPRRDEFCEVGTAFIRAADMDNGRLLFESAQCVNDTAMERIRKGVGAGGDVILSHKGTVGKVAYVPLDAPPFVCSPQTTFWRTLDNDQIDRRYLYAFLNSQHFRNQLYSRANETDMAGYVSLTAQRALKVVLPPIEEQRAIASILGALDDKIELNRRMNATLESLARAIFKSWFVDFDPVKINAGQIPASSAIPTTHDPKVLDLFPSTFQDSELGPIPEGWEVRAFESAFEIPLRNGVSRPKKVRGSGMHMVNMGELFAYKRLGNVPMERVPMTEKDIERCSIQEDDILFARQSLILEGAGQTSFVVPAREPRTFESHLIRCRIDKSKAEPLYFFYFFDSALGTHLVSSIVNHTAAAGIRGSDLAKLDVPVPPRALQQAFVESVTAIESSIATNQDETTQLGLIRDTLLPRLLSGELAIPEALTATEEALA